MIANCRLTVDHYQNSDLQLAICSLQSQESANGLVPGENQVVLCWFRGMCQILEKQATNLTNCTKRLGQARLGRGVSCRAFV